MSAASSRGKVSPHEDYGLFGPGSITWRVWMYPTSLTVGFQRVRSESGSSWRRARRCPTNEQRRYWTASRSITNTKVAFGAITGGWPAGP